MTVGRWQLFPDLMPEKFAALKAEIAERGVIVPVVIDAETGEVIDGHHRLRAVEQLRSEGAKVAPYPREVRAFVDDEERTTVALALNLARRHMTREQRGELVATLRGRGWSVRRIASVTGIPSSTVGDDLSIVRDRTISEPARIDRKGGGTYPARRPSIMVSSDRDQHRAESALRALGETAPSRSLDLKGAEAKAREARLARMRSTDVPERIDGPRYELRLGDLREAWADLPDRSVDAFVTDPPYDNAGVPLFEDLARLALRVLKPGRLAAVYCGHVALPEEMALLEAGGLAYVWHGVNVLPGLHSNVRVHLINGHHRSVLLYSAGRYQPRRWIHDAHTVGDGRGGPESRPLHAWQQAVGPCSHWVRSASEPGEVVFDPFVGSGTTAVAAVTEGRRFLGGDIDPASVETTRQRLAELSDAEVTPA